MNSIKSFFVAAVASCALLGMQSCVKNDTPSVPATYVDLNSANIPYTTAGYWAYCYDIATGNLVVDGVSFSHKAWADEWDGVSYPAWNGFCPSKVSDTEDHKDDWTQNQWACVVPNPMNYVYLVGNSESVVSENPLDNNKCAIRMNNYGRFTPQYISVTNSTYTYYCAKDGSAFNEPFTAEDNFMLHIVGVRSGVMTGHMRLMMINNLQFLTQWYPVDLSGFGEVDELLFYVDSTKKNSYGLTVPAYFCVGGFAYSLPAETSAN